MFAILSRRNAEKPNESSPHLLLVREAAIFGNRLDSICCFLQLATCCVDARVLDGLCGCPTHRIRLKPSEVCGAHVYTFCKRLDSEVAFSNVLRSTVPGR